jgi:hypothetical protein
MARWTAALVALALMGAACSNGGGDDGVATLGGDQGAAAASASPSADPEDALAEFAECMRENGIEDFPDPQIDEDGRITFGAPSGGGDGEAPEPGDRERLDEAMAACQDLLPQGLGPGNLTPEDEAAFQDALVDYTDCMREQGIDMPDPDFSGDGGGFIGGAEGVDPQDPAFQDADELCRHFLEDAGFGPGEEAGSDANA